MFAKQAVMSPSDEDEYWAEKMALIIKEMLVDEKRHWVSSSYSTTLFPADQALDSSSDADRNSSSSFPLKYSNNSITDQYIDTLAKLDNRDQSLSLIDIESESDSEEYASKSVLPRRHLITGIQHSYTQTYGTSNNDQFFVKQKTKKYQGLDFEPQRRTNKRHNDTPDADDIPTIFSPLDFSPSGDSESSEITNMVTELRLAKATKRNYFISNSSTADSQTSSANTDMAVTKPSLSANSNSSKTSDGSSFGQHILPMNTKQKYSLQSNARGVAVNASCKVADLALSNTKAPPESESQSSFDRETEQNSDSESFRRSKSMSSSSESKTKNTGVDMTSGDSNSTTQTFTNPSINSLSKHLLELLLLDRSKRQKIYASVSENWNTSSKDTQGVSKPVKNVNQSLHKTVKAPNVKSSTRGQSIPSFWYNKDDNHAPRSPTPKHSSTSRTSTSSSDSFLDIFLAKNPSVLLNRHNNTQNSLHENRKKSRSSLFWLRKEKQKNYLQVSSSKKRNYLQISSSRKRKRKANISQAKPMLIYFLRDKMAVEGPHIQQSASKNDVKILMPAKPGRMKNSGSSSNGQSPCSPEMHRKRHCTFLCRLCSSFLCCISRK